jgi:hypothetical protein
MCSLPRPPFRCRFQKNFRFSNVCWPRQEIANSTWLFPAPRGSWTPKRWGTNLRSRTRVTRAWSQATRIDGLTSIFRIRITGHRPTCLAKASSSQFWVLTIRIRMPMPISALTLTCRQRRTRIGIESCFHLLPAETTDRLTHSPTYFSFKIHSN